MQTFPYPSNCFGGTTAFLRLRDVTAVSLKTTGLSLMLISPVFPKESPALAQREFVTVTETPGKRVDKSEDPPVWHGGGVILKVYLMSNECCVTDPELISLQRRSGKAAFRNIWTFICCPPGVTARASLLETDDSQQPLKTLQNKHVHQK